MGTFGGNGAEDISNTHVFSAPYHVEDSATDSGRDMGDARGGISAGSGRNIVGDDLHRETAGNRGKVG